MNAETALTRRQLMIAGAGAALTLSLPIELAAASPSKIQVFKTPTCGCCKMWVEHLTASGFKVEAEDLAELEAVKQMAGVPDHLLSCHTGIVEGYTIEGHVPAAAIEKLLAERPPHQGPRRSRHAGRIAGHAEPDAGTIRRRRLRRGAGRGVHELRRDRSGLSPTKNRLRSLTITPSRSNLASAR